MARTSSTERDEAEMRRQRRRELEEVAKARSNMASEEEQEGKRETPAEARRRELQELTKARYNRKLQKIEEKLMRLLFLKRSENHPEAVVEQSTSAEQAESARDLRRRELEEVAKARGRMEWEQQPKREEEERREDEKRRELQELAKARYMGKKLSP